MQRPSPAVSRSPSRVNTGCTLVIGPDSAARTHATSSPRSLTAGRSEGGRADDDQELRVGVPLVGELVRQFPVDLDAVALVELVELAGDLRDDPPAEHEAAL